VTAARVIDWLLEEDQPAVRYRTLTELLGRRRSDPDVREAKRAIPGRGWVAEILRDRDPAGWWAGEDSLYVPKYVATNWRMIVLADLGVDRSLRWVRESAELWMRRFALEGGGVGGNAKGKGHHCVVGNMARALIQLGYQDDPRIRVSLDWLVATASPKGGWSCFFPGGRTLDSWEGLSALAAYPRSKRTPEMEAAIEKGAEFYLGRELHRQGDRYAPWYRFHYPVHYYYDLLVGLEILTSLGYAEDPRLAYAVKTLRARRRPDGRWNLDRVHPDAGGSLGAWLRAHPKSRPNPWALETPGRPSKMITLRALLVEQRLAD
jgi:hypothetical protein